MNGHANKPIRALALLASFGLTFGLLAQPAAADASRQETIGLGAGGVIGAVAAGPFGFMAGAAIGAKLGDAFHQKDERNRELDGALVSAQETIDELEVQLAAMDSDIEALGQELNRVLASGGPEMLELLNAGIEMDLLFRTEADTLNADLAARVDELAKLLATLPSVQIRLDAYADPRGEEDYNQALTERRAEHVRELLLGAGVEGSRVTAVAHGEIGDTQADADRHALERRVSLTLYVPKEPTPRVADTR